MARAGADATVAVLPDCMARPGIEALDARQRAELVRVLAQEGPGAVEAWLRREEQRDPHVRARLARHRERLEREARIERERLDARQRGERETLESTWERRGREHAEREALLRSRIALAAGAPVFDLGAAEAAILAPTGRPPRRLGWLRRLLVRLALWWAGVQAALVGAAKARSRRRIRIGDQEVDLERVAREHPETLAAARRRKPWWRRILGWLRRLVGLDDAYRDLAEALREQAEAERRRGIVLASQVRTESESELESLQRAGAADLEERRRQLAELEAAQDAARRELDARRGDEPYRTLVDEVMGEMADAGLVDAQGQATERLLRRFGGMLYQDALRGLSEGGAAVPGTYQGGEGEYERGPLVSLHELGAMELVDSLMRARIRHPHVRHIQDDDILVHRETRTARAHVVVIFDHSNSMEEGDRLEAARKVCLVLHRALAEEDPDSRIDFVAMGTGARRVGLAECWAATPAGFTNFGAALRAARGILESDNADRRLVYVITDGLPEARTLPDGRDVADRADACMPDALAAAKQLHEAVAPSLLVLQLELRDPKYLDAARRIAKAGGGRVVGLDPKELARTLLVDLASSRKPAVAAA